MKIIEMVCAICEEHFYIDESDHAYNCAMCGDATNFYPKRIFNAEPTGEEVL